VVLARGLCCLTAGYSKALLAAAFQG
jgi:hypothetical protein